MMRKLSIFSLFFVLACGRTILPDPVSSYSLPIITAVNVSSQTPVMKIQLNWNFPTSEESIIQGFKVERSENNGDFSVVSDKILGNLRSLEFVENARNTPVTYRVSTINGENSQTSLPVSYFLPVGNLATTNCIIASATLIGSGNEQPRIYLSWNNTNLLPNYTGTFQVLRNTQSVPTPQVIATTSNRFLIDDKVTVGGNYTYSVRPSGSSCATNPVSILVIPSPLGQCPVNLSAKIITEQGVKSVILTWNGQIADFSTFTVRRSGTPDGNFTTISPSDWAGEITVFQDRNIGESGKVFYYKIISNINSNPPATCESNIVKVQF